MGFFSLLYNSGNKRGVNVGRKVSFGIFSLIVWFVFIPISNMYLPARISAADLLVIREAVLHSLTGRYTMNVNLWYFSTWNTYYKWIVKCYCYQKSLEVLLFVIFCTPPPPHKKNWSSRFVIIAAVFSTIYHLCIFVVKGLYVILT